MGREHRRRHDRDRQRKLISKIDAALQRIEDNTYGYCEETGEPISLKRLDARPIAIFNIKGEFFGLLNRCPHQGAALCEGPLIGLAQSSDPGEIEYTSEGGRGTIFKIYLPAAPPSKLTTDKNNDAGQESLDSTGCDSIGSYDQQLDCRLERQVRH